MKKTTGILSIILFIILIPFRLVELTAFKMTKGRKLSEKDIQQFVDNFMNKFGRIICKALDIPDIPIITLTRKTNHTKESRTVGSFVIGNLMDILCLMFKGKADSILDTGNGIERDKHPIHRIELYYNNIFKLAKNNNIIIQYITIKTLMHELVHYKQYISGMLKPEDMIAYSNFNDYNHKDTEINARKVSRRFSFKHFFSIGKFILHGDINYEKDINKRKCKFKTSFIYQVLYTGTY